LEYCFSITFHDRVTTNKIRPQKRIMYFCEFEKSFKRLFLRHKIRAAP